MDNTELIKLTAQFVHLKHQLPKDIRGYEKSIVRETVKEMIEKKAIFEGEIQSTPWGADPSNRTKQYRRMMYCIDKEVIKSEYGVDVFKVQ
jgi:hypothetical protein